MNNCKFSVVIPCYNYGKYLGEAIDSILKSTFQGFEIIVVDDGSNDPHTLKILTSFNDPRIRIIRQENKGLSNARNTGIRNSCGGYILCLDADDLIGPTFLEKSYWVLKEERNVGIVSCWTQNFGEEEYTWKPGFFSYYKLLRENTLHSASIFRRQCWEKVNGYDERMKHGYEDWEFWIKIIKTGWNVGYIPEALFFYRRHKGSMLKKSRKFHEELVDYIRKKHHVLFRADKQVLLLIKAIVDFVRSKAFTDSVGNLIFKHFPPKIAYKIAHLCYSCLDYWGKIRTKLLVSRPLKSEGKPQAAVCYQVKKASGDKRPVLCIFPWLEIGGADKVNLDVLSCIREKYYPIVVTTVPSDNPWHGFFEKITPEIFHLPNFLKLEDIDEVAAFLISIIATRGIGLIFLSNSLLGYRILSRVKDAYPGIPVISLVHLYLPQEKWDFLRVAAQFDEYVSHHITVANHVKENMQGLGIQAQSITIIPNAIDSNKFSPLVKEELRQKKRRELCIPDNQLVIAFVGRFTSQKQPVYFLTIADMILNANIVSKHKDITFIMIGDGELMPSVEKLVKKRELQSNIRLLGSCNDVRPFLSCSDILILPSLLEGLPIIGLEAMAMELPIIASDVPGWQELITDKQSGFLVSLNKPDDFVRVGTELLDNPILRERIGHSAREIILEGYTLERMKNKYLIVFDSYSDGLVEYETKS